MYGNDEKYTELQIIDLEQTHEQSRKVNMRITMHTEGKKLIFFVMNVNVIKKD